MKRIICIILILCLFPVITIADGFVNFVEKWNKAAYIYKVTELSDDMFTQDGLIYSSSCDEWQMSVMAGNQKAVQAELTSADTNTFLSMCVILGVAIVQSKSVEAFTRFKSNVLDMYLRVAAGDDPRTAAFETFIFTIEKREDVLFFSISEL